MPGPAPKPDVLRTRRNRSVTASEFVDTSPIADGKIPPLTRRRDELGHTVPWSRATRAWWRDIWRSPMAGEYTRADVHGLRLIAELRERSERKPSAALSAEIRLQEARFGLDVWARRRLQWQIRKMEKDQPQKPPATPARETEDPRARLRSVK